MADGIVWNLASKALEVLGKEAIRKAASWWGARDDLDKLGETTRTIQARVRDAERRQEGESSEFIKLWLQRLRLVLYRADDLFDEVLTLDLLKQQQMEKRMLCKVGILFTKSGPLCYNWKLANEIKSIRKELDDIKSDIDHLNLSVLPAQEPSMTPLLENRETTSFLTETVIGRESDKKKIIEMLVDPKKDEEDITVIPIVGFGGLGKTTLAQLVFNDETVQNRFYPTAWAYVPEKDNLNIIKRKIFQAFTEKNYQDKSLGYIENSIIKSIENKRYLLVLDDLWIDKGADITKLLSLLKGGKHGSKVIVTTRLDAVAMHFGPIEAAYKLGTLSDDKSWELFEKLAFGPGQENNKTEMCTIGKDIVKMCGNMPLAIEVVGGSLRSKHTQAEWLQVKQDLTKAQLTDYHDLMAILKLSYDSLSPVLKPCFAYCSLFPKGYEFQNDELVHLWMAQGYVDGLDKGKQYFLDLVARNLIQVSKISYARRGNICKMHDLLHDLAQVVAGNESIMLGNGCPNQIHNGLVHVNLNGLESPPSLKKASRLRSLLKLKSNITDDNFFSKFQSLRVLTMHHSNGYENLPNSIGRLIHLRYLKLKSGAIEYLPDSITRLVNLQTLNLQSCQELKELPTEFAKLVNLRHLFLPCEKLTSLPPGFGKLTSLQEFHWLTREQENGTNSLTMWFYRKWHKDAIEEVKRVNLGNNHQLTSLALQLDIKEEESTIVGAGEMNNEWLRYLLLPPNLKDLDVRDYKGDKMPIRWLEGLSQLVSIRIYNCRECKVVPKLSGLPHLKYLELLQFDELEYIEEDEDNINVGTASATHNNRCFFPSLEVLRLEKCCKLKGWRRASKDDGEQRQLVFPCLLKMQVHECPMLVSMPVAPKLDKLFVCGINWKIVESSKVRSNDDNEEAVASSSSAPQSSSTLSTTLKELEIQRVGDELISLSIGSSLCNLSILIIAECSELRKLRFESPNSLQEMTIKRCRRLKNIGEGLQHLCWLEKLFIYECEELEMEEEEEQQQQQQEEGKSSRGWQGLSSLRKLFLKNLPKVKTLLRGIGCVTTLQVLSIAKMQDLREIPEEIGNLSLLCNLSISGCPNVKSLPQSILQLAKLQMLRLWGMDNLTELPGEIGNGNLPLLSCLQIVNCPKMKSLPPSIKGLASLKYLNIEGCPDLAKKNMPNGEDRHLIQHLPYLVISQEYKTSYDPIEKETLKKTAYDEGLAFFFEIEHPLTEGDHDFLHRNIKFY